MHTEVATSDKENKHARDEGNQLKRGATIGTNHNNNGYGRSDSNTNKHRVSMELFIIRYRITDIAISVMTC